MASTTEQLAQATQGPRTDSAGDITADAAQARDQGALTQSPDLGTQQIQPSDQRSPGTGAGATGDVAAQTTAEPTTAERPRLSIDITTTNQPGVNDDVVRTTVETQATPPITAAPGPVPPNGVGTAPATPGTTTPDDGYTYYGGTPGVATPGDDNTPPNANATRQAINQQFSDRIQPRPNVLDQYASYTYSISIYIMRPQDYRDLLITKQRRVPANQLLIQSGGAPAPDRNPNFGLDFYIDNLRLKSVVSGKGTRGPHNVVEMDFTITEPNGISLLPRLFRATQQYVAQTEADVREPLNYAAQNFLMVIRFYGYDSQGREVPASESTPTGTTDRRAIVEKFIPFRFTGIEFSVANRLTTYQCRAVCPQNDTATAQGRGSIPYNVQLTSTTVRELLAGSADVRTSGSAAASSANQSQAESARLARQSAPLKADSAPSAGTITQGLADALNRYQEQLVNRGVIAVADEYRFEFADEIIANARLKPPGQTDLASTGQPVPTTASQARDGAQQSVQRDSKNFTVTAGTNIVQFLDMVLRNSTYIFDQQSWIYDPKRNTLIPQGTPANSFAWYRVGVQSVPIGYDKIRKDWAYQITYQISIYRVNAVDSPYFPQGRFTGTHKRYNYWFTGQNTAIRNFEQKFDYLYYITVNVPPGSTGVSATSDYREFEKRLAQPRSPESSQYSSGSVGEPAANAADRLYSPSDLSRINLNIVGDPAWIQQGDVWSGVGGPGINERSAQAFLPDGTINYERQEVLFEVAWNGPSDYDLSTGLMPIQGAQQ